MRLGLCQDGCVDEHRSVRVVDERFRLDRSALRELDRRLGGYREFADLGSGGIEACRATGWTTS
jgi:hypothetical protein